jgi:tetratricopeptide (TPR) repeat protein
MHGQRRASHALYQHAAEAARRQALRSVAAEFQEADARADALAGDCRSTFQLGRPALALALCGDTAKAEEAAAKITKTRPDDTIWRAVQLPEVEAAVALNRKDAAKAVETMASATPYESAYPDAIYLRGLAYLRMSKGSEAAAEFRKIVDHEGTSWGATWIHPNQGQYYALAHLGMCWTAKEQRRRRPSMTSSLCGRTPIATFQFFARRSRCT